ncbi:MAG: hypothetical protein JW751_18005 [Polyangiaceae bacterium]|nr:hypothetical protein [Polyangiaceae bacterium]
MAHDIDSCAYLHLVTKLIVAGIRTRSFAIWFPFTPPRDGVRVSGRRQAG